ncbi:MAG: IS21 family transposase [Bacteroidetes bacterium]|nr:IS21 family transposase [Bacteroidota bacterium]
MDQYELIRIAHRTYGEGVKALARRTGHSRNTIRKALRGPYPGYQPRATQPYPILGPFLSMIDRWLEQDKDQPRKQRHMAERVFQRLVAKHAYTGCVSTVRKYVREAKLKLGLTACKVFLPLQPDPSREAEADWGQAYAEINGVLERLHYFCMRSKGSGKPFVRLYRCERQQALFDAMMHAFLFFGGIFRILVFDNMKTAVLRILQRKNREEQETFARFRAYHTFEARFCNRAAGNEKGGVEGLVGFVRRNFLMPVPKAPSLEELNARLLAQCIAYGGHTISGRDKPVHVLFEEEKVELLPLPAVPFENNLPPLTKYPDKYSTIIFEKNRYSVPTHLAGYPIRIICFIDTLEFFSQGKRVVVHPRQYGSGKWQLAPDHYLELLRQRPLAFDCARPIKQWRAQWTPEMVQLLERFRQTHEFNRGTKDFIDVLLLYHDHSATAIEAAIAEALTIGIRDSEAVRHLLHRRTPTVPIAPLEQYPRFPEADVTVYAALGGVQ